MTTTKHTPGPWTLGDPVHEFPTGQSWSVPVWANEAESGDKIAAEAHARNREQARASARLIAAAPLMEKSLAHILVLIQQGVDDNDLEAIEGHCRAALATAWGVHADQVWTPDLAQFESLEGGVC